MRTKEYYEIRNEDEKKIYNEMCDERIRHMYLV